MKKFDKKELIRIVKKPDGTICIESGENSDGRGAYICKNKNCIENTQKRDKLKRALKCELSNEIYNKLLERV